MPAPVTDPEMCNEDGGEGQETEGNVQVKGRRAEEIADTCKKQQAS
jgi:hypothetical protein